jgi:2-polyprenyl-3-methyl-5-hydroxy-6-metoxy-1,4-benzoquinol methylase
MLSGKKRVLEVGCGDGFASRVVRQEVERLTAVDFDPIFIEDARKHGSARWDISFETHDILTGPVSGSFDAAYSMDVLEHIPGDQEHRYMDHIMRSLTDHGVLMIGTPSLESQAHASPPSKAGHVNCKTSAQLKELMLVYFHTVFMFSMNDEVVHTGYSAMAHYLIGTGCDRRANTP